MTTIRRGDRVGKQLQVELSRLVQREVKDPRVQSVTLTRVEVTDDLREARVYFVPMGGIGDMDRVSELEVGLRAASAFLQRKAGRNLRLRFTPKLSFRYDVGVANLVDMHDLMDGLRAGEEASDAVTPSEPLAAAVAPSEGDSTEDGQG